MVKRALFFLPRFIDLRRNKFPATAIADCEAGQSWSLVSQGLDQDFQNWMRAEVILGNSANNSHTKRA